MPLSASDAHLAYQQSLINEQRYIWHQGLRFLGCYSDAFYLEHNGDELKLVYTMLHEAHVIELGFPRHLPTANRREPLSLKIWCLQYSLQNGSLLQTVDGFGSVRAATILSDVENWATEEREHLKPRYVEMCRTFLEDEICTIPKCVWKQALPTHT